MLTSIFERLWEQAMAQVRKSGTDAHDWQRSMVMLREHFRMHEDIAWHVNPNYGGKLQIGKPKEQQAAFPRTLSKNPLERLLTTHRVLFFESPAGDQRIHPFEATMVRHIVQALQSVDPQVLQRPDGIGIITPWRAQISCILKELAHAGINGVPVDTVERFQGSECDNIIVSLSTSNEGLLSALCASVYGSGSSEVDRKLNVTLSRAKSRLILLGEPAVLSENPHYHKLIRAIQQQGGFISNSTSTAYTPAT